MAQNSHDTGNLQFLLVARHGSRKKNLEDVDEVAQHLSETLGDLQSLSIPIKLRAVKHSGTPEAARTAAAFTQALKGSAVYPAQEDLQLGPPRIGPYWKPSSGVAGGEDDEGTEQRIQDAWKAVNKYLNASSDPNGGNGSHGSMNTLMLVGNQPAVDWFLAEVDKRIAIAPGEVVCLVRKVHGPSVQTHTSPWWPFLGRRPGYRWHLWWVISPDQERTMDELRQKIESKMTVLSVLAGFTAAIMTTVAVELAGNPISDVAVELDGNSISDLWRRRMLLTSVGFFALSIVIEVGALLAYDRLMMPARFWSTTHLSKSDPRDLLQSWPVWRPPSSAAWVVYQQSLRLWRGVEFALAVAGIGGLLVIAAVGKTGWEIFITVLVAILVIGVATVWWRLMQPDLGTED